MPNENIPLKIDPFRFADNSTRLHGFLSIENMPRLCESLAENVGNVEVDIQFGLDEQGIRFLKGSMTTRLKLQCQRCMEPFEYEIIGDFLWGIIQSEDEVNGLPKNYDPLVVEGTELNIQDLVEDELIINLPIVAMHEPDECEVRLPLVAESEHLSEVERDNPFKVIELLRKKRN